MMQVVLFIGLVFGAVVRQHSEDLLERVETEITAAGGMSRREASAAGGTSSDVVSTEVKINADGSTASSDVEASSESRDSGVDKVQAYSLAASCAPEKIRMMVFGHAGSIQPFWNETNRHRMSEQYPMQGLGDFANTRLNYLYGHPTEPREKWPFPNRTEALFNHPCPECFADSEDGPVIIDNPLHMDQRVFAPMRNGSVDPLENLTVQTLEAFLKSRGNISFIQNRSENATDLARFSLQQELTRRLHFTGKFAPTKAALFAVEPATFLDLFCINTSHGWKYRTLKQFYPFGRYSAKEMYGVEENHYDTTLKDFAYRVIQILGKPNETRTNDEHRDAWLATEKLYVHVNSANPGLIPPTAQEEDKQKLAEQVMLLSQCGDDCTNKVQEEIDFFAHLANESASFAPMGTRILAGEDLFWESMKMPADDYKPPTLGMVRSLLLSGIMLYQSMQFNERVEILQSV